jgi:hypothetical protein
MNWSFLGYNQFLQKQSDGSGHLFDRDCLVNLCSLAVATIKGEKRKMINKNP